MAMMASTRSIATAAVPMEAILVDVAVEENGAVVVATEVMAVDVAEEATVAQVCHREEARADKRRRNDAIIAC